MKFPTFMSNIYLSIFLGAYQSFRELQMKG